MEVSREVGVAALSQAYTDLTFHFAVRQQPERAFQSSLIVKANDVFHFTLVFPGGFLPSVAYCTEMISKGSQNRLTVDSMVNIGVSLDERSRLGSTQLQSDHPNTFLPF